MAAYAALVSLMQILDQIEHHPSPPISMDKKQVESLAEIVMSLQKFLEGYESPYADGDEADPLEMRIADAVYAVENAIESHIVDRIRPSVVVWYEALWDVMKEGMDSMSTFTSLLQIHVPDAYSIPATLLFWLLDWNKDKVIKDMYWIIAVKGQLLQRQVSSSADLMYKSEVKLIFALTDQQNRQVSESAGSSTSADLFYMSLQKVIEDMALIKKEVMEFVALKEERQVSASLDLHESLQKVIEHMDLIKKEVMEIVALKDQRQVAGGSSASSLSRLNSITMEGFDDAMLQLMEKLIYGQPDRQVIPIVGMGGIGKTTLAKNVCAHPSISHHFDIYAWVTISQQYNTKELLREILSQANKQGLNQMSEENEIGVALHKCLTYRRYLVVLDDMWSIEAWDAIQRNLPNNSNGSRIMVTTRLSNLGSQLDNNYSLQMKFMAEESSWNIFCKTVFGGKSCPLELEKIGKEIVKSCRGLPLSIVVMGGLLEKQELTKECWEAIRISINSLVNLENCKHCLKILMLSYNHLPVYLKPCFLYLGMLEEDSEIRVSTLIKLWVSEGFLKPVYGKSLETIAKEYLDELVDRNLILVNKLGLTAKMKYCRIHDLLRDLCLREAEKERFYDVVGQHSPHGTCSQRRVFIMKNTSKEKVVDAIKSRPYARTCISDCERVRLLPYLILLRTMRIYNDKLCAYSQENIFELVNLRLLEFRSDKNSSYSVPSSMKLLWSLQTLIVSSYSQAIVKAPVEIWKMSQLRHIIVGHNPWHLPDPPSDNIVIMENLQTLKGVSNFKCDEMMLRRIPNIKKLGLTYDEDIEHSDDKHCVYNIERLQKLESLSCKGYGRRGLLQKITFPHSLKSLTVDFKYYRMKDMLEKVSTLPLLQKLKLTGGDFTTGKWETVEGQFLSLKYLSITGCRQLEWWTMESSHFPCLEHLELSSMPDLKEIPAELGDILTLKSVTLEYCRESVVRSAKTMVEEQVGLQGQELSFQVRVYFCCVENNKLLRRLTTPNFRVVL